MRVKGNAYKILTFLLYYKGVNHGRSVIERFGDVLLVQTIPFAMRVLNTPKRFREYMSDLIELGFVRDIKYRRGYFTCTLVSPDYIPDNRTELDLPIDMNTTATNLMKQENTLLRMPLKELIREFGLPLDFKSIAEVK